MKLIATLFLIFNLTTLFLCQQFRNIITDNEKEVTLSETLFNSMIPFYPEERTNFIENFDEKKEEIAKKDGKGFIELPNTNFPFKRLSEYYIESVEKNRKKLQPNKEFVFNNKYSKNLMYYPIENNQINSQNSTDIKIELVQPNVNLISKLNQKFLHVENVLNFNNFIVGLELGKLKLYSLNTQIKEENIDNFFKLENREKISDKEIKYILEDSNENKKEKILLLEDRVSKLYLFKILLLTGHVQFIHTGEIINTTFKKITNFIFDENKFQNKLFLVIDKKDIYITDIMDNSKTSKLDLPSDVKNILDIQQIRDDVFVLIENFGIKSMNLIDEKNNKFGFSDFQIKHKEMIKFNYAGGPSNELIDAKKNFSILGVIVNTTNEFYYEYTIEKEQKANNSNVLLYRVFTKLANSIIDLGSSPMVYNLDSFTYFFDNLSSSIISIDRSFAGDSISSVYKLKIDAITLQGKVLNIFAFKIANIDSNFIVLSYSESDNKLLIFEEQRIKPKLNFEVLSPGDYEITLSSLLDYCTIGNNLKHTYRKCKKEFKYNFSVSMNEIHTDYAAEMYGFVFLLWVVLTLVNLFIWHSNRERKNVVVSTPLPHDISFSVTS
jgi:hypothetical protein